MKLAPQPWRWSRPRVLVEHADEAVGLAISDRLRRAGYAVALCSGPVHEHDCPLTGTEGCAVARDADAIVSCLGVDRQPGRAVVDALRARCADVPLVLEVADGEVEEELAGCTFVTAPAGPARVVAALDGLLRERVVA